MLNTKLEHKKIELNEKQIEAINTIAGNLLIIASAGTGKTTTIIERYANLVINHGYKTNQVLMTTFTNKAAKDMMKKIEARTGSLPEFVGTMHSIFLKILRKYSSILLSGHGFTITDENDKEKIIKNILLKLKVDGKKDNIRFFLYRITRFKNACLTSDMIDRSSYDSSDKERVEKIMLGDDLLAIKGELMKLVPSIYKEYESYLRKNNLIDLDDILLLTYRLFSENPEILKKYKEQFKQIMVDEAQDLNFVQMQILNLLGNNNLCLIGDDCQNIYEWRGSSNDLVFKFNKHFNTITLTDNYRSSGKIIEAINKTIKSMRFKIDKRLTCTKEIGHDIKVNSFEDFDDETDFIVNNIKKLIKNGNNINDIAVLFRTNHIGKTFERQLIKKGIPCHLSKSRGFFDRAEIKDILSFLKIKVNSASLIDFERIVMMLEGFGKSKIKILEEFAKKKKCSIVETLNYIRELELNDKLSNRLIELMEALRIEATNPVDVFMGLLKYREMLQSKYADDPEKAEDKLENLKVIKDLLKEYPSTKQGLIDFLDDTLDIEKKEKGKDKVTLSTVHSAKGLEWQHVYIACCNEEILPFYKNEISVLDLDSELRLFYVAVSRAKEFLTVTYSDFNTYKDLEPSRFIEMLD